MTPRSAPGMCNYYTVRIKIKYAWKFRPILLLNQTSSLHAEFLFSGVDVSRRFEDGVRTSRPHIYISIKTRRHFRPFTSTSNMRNTTGILELVAVITSNSQGAYCLLGRRKLKYYHENGSLLIEDLTLGSTYSFRYENFVTGATLV